MSAENRIKAELLEIEKDPPDNCSAGMESDDIYTWEATLMGPTGSVYEGGVFHLSIKFPKNYPFFFFFLKFLTKIYHLNVNMSGGICLDVLKDNWSPALTISKILLSISSLLTDPNPDDPLVPEIRDIYVKNRLQFDLTAREWTQFYANN